MRISAARYLVPVALLVLSVGGCKKEVKGFAFEAPAALQKVKIPQLGTAGVLKTKNYEVKILARGFYKHVQVVLEYGFKLNAGKSLPFPENEVRLKSGDEVRGPTSRAVITPLRGKNQNRRSRLVFKVGRPISSFTLLLPKDRLVKGHIPLVFQAVRVQFVPIASEYARIKATRPFLLESDEKYY